MGNLSCVKSSDAKSQQKNREDGPTQLGNQRSTGSRGKVNVSSIPKIVLDPGSSANSIPEREQGSTIFLEDQREQDVHQKAEDVPCEDGDQRKVASSTDIREMYAITPPASFTDSSEEEDGCNEASPLVKTRPPSFEVSSSTEQPKPSSSKSTLWETRPFLSRQLEIDLGSQSSKDANLNSVQEIDEEEGSTKNANDCHHAKIPDTLNLSESINDVESQRVMPILFTLSPTKKGTNQVVSVVATRDLPAAFSQSPSLPSSPFGLKPRSPKVPRSPRSPRSPKSLKSFRGIFGCRSSSEKDIPNHNEHTSNGNISLTTTNENCTGKTAGEDTLDKSSINEETCAQNEDVLSNGEIPTNCGEISNGCLTTSVFVSERKGILNKRGNQSEAFKASHPDSLLQGNNDASVAKTSLVEDAVIVLHSAPFPTCAEVLSHRMSTQDSLSEKGSNAHDSFEESTNSDKGYESVDNSPSVENEENICRSLNSNGSVPSNEISKLAQNENLEMSHKGLDNNITVISNKPVNPECSVWVPVTEPRASPTRKRVTTTIAASQPDCNQFSQTAV